jgi:hypothetical protein
MGCMNRYVGKIFRSLFEMIELWNFRADSAKSISEWNFFIFHETRFPSSLSILKMFQSFSGQTDRRNSREHDNRKILRTVHTNFRVCSHHTSIFLSPGDSSTNSRHEKVCTSSNSSQSTENSATSHEGSQAAEIPAVPQDPMDSTCWAIVGWLWVWIASQSTHPILQRDQKNSNLENFVDRNSKSPKLQWYLS